MLSAANPPEPPCISKISALNSDEKGHPSERPSSSPEAADPADGLDQAKQPPFSIRDYVFAGRSKDVGINWPFPQQYLQLFMKHGVRELLPPFEPPDLVRARFRESVGVEYPISFSEVERTQTEVSDAVKHSFNLPNQESAGLGSSRQPRNPLSEDESVVVQAVGFEEELFHREAEWKITGYECTKKVLGSVSQLLGSVQETRSTVSGSSSEVEVAKPPQSAQISAGLSERFIKRYKLIVKFGGAPEPNRTEGTVSNFTSVSDPMTSKVCPVCKTFSSTSNTTLNAHIDQCLSVESGAKWDTIKLSHHKMKPRKKRSMEDICATAPCCTLEDLDRRNGTNWALDLAFMTQNSRALCTTEGKQPRFSPPEATDDERGGAVYIDSNGTKLLILSKFNNAQSAAAVDCSVAKKCKRQFKNKSSPIGKRKSLPPKYRKYLKNEVHKKKMSSSSDVKGEVRKEGKLHLDTHHEERRILQASHAPEQMKVGKPGTLGHWICSKRSSLLKHLNSQSGLSKPMNSLAIVHHTSVESDQSASCDYSTIRGHIQKFHKPSDDILSPPKARSANVLSDAVLASNDQGKHLADSPVKNVLIRNDSSTSNRVTLKVSRSTRKCVSSAKGKKVEMHASAVQKSVKFQRMRKPPVNYSPQVHKGQKGSTRYSTMDVEHCIKETINYHVVGQGLVSKKLRKHRFAGKSHKAILKSPLELDEGFCGSRSAHSPGSTSHNVISRMDQSNFSETVMRPETTNTLSHVSSDQHDPMDPNQGETDYHPSKGGECPTLNDSQHEAECCHAEVTEFDAQIQVPINMDSMVKYTLEKTIGTCGNKDMTSEDNDATTCGRLGSRLSPEHEIEHNRPTEAIIEASIIPKSVSNQGTHLHVLASDVVSQDIWGIAQTELSVKDGYCSELQNIQYQVDVASIEGSSVCLPGHEYAALEPIKTSSMVSGRTVTTEIHNMMVDRRSSGSPVSASSIISQPSVEDLKSKDSEQEASEEPIVIQENLRTAKNLRILVNDSVRGTETSNPDKAFQKLKVAMTMQNPQELWDGQPCCCSRRENIPRKYRILRQSAIDRVVLPAKTKQNTSSLVRAFPTDSHSDSVSVSASSEVTDGFPAFGSSRSASSSSHIQPQSTSSPFLRLMGKNLIVMNNEERPVQQQNQTDPCSSEDTSNGKYMSLLGFSSICSFSNLDSIQCHPQQSLESPLTGQHPSNFQAPFPPPAKQMGGSGGPVLQSIVTREVDPHAHHHRWDKNSLAVCNSEKVCTPHERLAPIPVTQSAFPERDVIVIDDSPEHEDEPSRSKKNPASYLASHFSGSDISADLELEENRRKFNFDG
ncbi:hypothetical protein Taro_015417 [Colocasia esculenta]|uniref:Uncharacterized protein n=1 Tax=Colocasia esculenta TaxID=4460 RepID=A0A843UPT4_COLES|nr:hypothetical protein [Colocasia esculenta]